MAITTKIPDENAQAELTMLNARMEKTKELNRKIMAALVRLDASGDSMQEAIGPIEKRTKSLQVQERNIRRVLDAIDKRPWGGQLDKRLPSMSREGVRDAGPARRQQRYRP